MVNEYWNLMLHLISIWSGLMLSLFLINGKISWICPWCHAHVPNRIWSCAGLISGLLSLQQVSHPLGTGNPGGAGPGSAQFVALGFVLGQHIPGASLSRVSCDYCHTAHSWAGSENCSLNPCRTFKRFILILQWLFCISQKNLKKLSLKNVLW